MRSTNEPKAQSQRSATLLSVVSVVVSLALIALSVVLAGCSPVTSGKEGRLYFQFAAQDALVLPTMDNTAIAAGARADVAVFSDSDRTPIEVDAATIAETGVLQVVGTAGHVVSLSADGSGVTELSVTTSLGSDRVELTVRALDTVEVTEPQAIGITARAHVVEGGTARLGYRMLDAGGERLVGYGLYPMAINPAGAAEIQTTRDIDHVSVQIRATGAIELAPSKGARVTLSAVPSSEVQLDALENAGVTLPVGESAIIVLRASAADGQPVVGLTGLVVVSATDPACDVRPSLELATSDDTFVVRGLAAGQCEVRAALGTQSVSTQLTVE